MTLTCSWVSKPFFLHRQLGLGKPPEKKHAVLHGNFASQQELGPFVSQNPHELHGILRFDFVRHLEKHNINHSKKYHLQQLKVLKHGLLLSFLRTLSCWQIWWNCPIDLHLFHLKNSSTPQKWQVGRCQINNNSNVECHIHLNIWSTYRQHMVHIANGSFCT